jgi:hypothetical protein
MRNRSAEESQYRIPGVLLDGSAIALDLPAHGLEVCRLDVSDFLGIEPRRQWGEADQIAEEGSDQAALFLRRVRE